jgi:hypothetical protein
VRTCEWCQFYARKSNLVHTSCKPSPSRGLSPCGGWTSSGPCEKRPGASPTY